MFADLKEYQDLTRIYNESVNISEEERQLQNFIEEENFTLEELEFCVENFEEICSLEFNEDYLTESNLNEEELHEILGVIGRKIARTLGKKAVVTIGKGGQVAAKNTSKITKGLKSFKKGGSALLSKVGSKVKNVASKVSKSGIGKRLTGAAKGALGAIKKGGIMVPGAIVAGGISGYIAGGKNKGNVKSTPEPSKGGGEKSAPLSPPEPPKADKSAPITPEPPKGGGESKAAPDKPTQVLPTPPKPQKAKSTKPMSKIEFQNRKRFGDDHVDHLKNKNKAFQAMKRGEITKQQFIKDFPKSQTAKRYNMSDKAYRDYRKGLKKEEFAKAYQSMYKQPENNIQEERQEVNEALPLLALGALGAGLALRNKNKNKKGKVAGKAAGAGAKLSKVGKAAAKGAARLTPGVALGLSAAKGAESLASKFKKGGGGAGGAAAAGAKNISKGSGRSRNLSRTMARNASAGARRVAMRRQFREEMEQYDYDTYDIVLEYLLQTEQVSTLEEANYVMSEMDGETINDILDEMAPILTEFFGLGRKTVAAGKAVAGAAGKVAGAVGKRVERRKQNVALNKRIKAKQSGPDANSGRTKAQIMALNRKKEKLNNPKEYARKQAMTGAEKAQAMAKARIAAKNAKR